MRGFATAIEPMISSVIILGYLRNVLEEKRQSGMADSITQPSLWQRAILTATTSILARLHVR
jgi:hypothetical protein